MNNWYEFKASAKGDETEILLYGEIGGFGISAESFVAALKQVPANQRINLRIYSPGGSVIEGNVIFDALRRHPGGVVTHIDGLAASMASVIALAGQPVKMAGNALYMIHNVSGSTYGEAEDMRKTADLLDKIQGLLVEAYAKKTRKPMAEIQSMMDEETWMTAKEAKEHGFIDEIEEPIEMAAKFDLSRFKNFDTTAKQTPASMPTYETPEFLALQSERDTLTSDLAKANFAVTTLTNDLAQAKAANEELSAKLNAGEKTLADALASVDTLKASFTELEAKHAKELADFDEKVGLKAAELTAQLGTTPHKISPNADTTITDEQYASEKDPVKKANMRKARIAAARK